MVAAISTASLGNEQDTSWLNDTFETAAISSHASRSLVAPKTPVIRERGSLINAWRNPEAQEMIRDLLSCGMFREDPLIADLLCNKIDQASELNLSDEDLFATLREIITESNLAPHAGEALARDEAMRVQTRIEQVLDILEKPRRMVDVGCGNGDILAGVTSAWQMSRDDVIGLDVEDRPNRNGSISFQELRDGHIPEDLRADTILLMMVLHHEEDPAQLLSEVYRTLEPGGVVLLREADIASLPEELFHAALDNIYFKVLNDLPGVPIPARYRSMERWGELAVKTGFTVEKIDRPEQGSPIRPFHMILRKEAKSI